MKLKSLAHDKPTLAIDARLINMSGIGTVCQNIIPLLIADFKIILLGIPKALKKFKWASDCEIIYFSNKIYSLQEQAGLFFKVPVCDYFLSPHYNIPLLPIRAKKRIVIIHDVNHIALQQTFSFAQKLFAKKVISKALQMSDKVITVSEFSKFEITRFFSFDAAKLFKISLGVDDSLYRKIESNLLNIVKVKYHLPEKFLLYVGNVKPHKNLSVLIRAYAVIKDKGKAKNYKLVIVGRKDGFITKENEIFKLIYDLNLNDDIIFTGFVETSDLPGIYNLAKLFVFPSIYEGFGLPPIEAMACGCPVLVSNSSSMPEVCGDAAIYFDPLDYNKLGNKILEVLNDLPLQNRLISNGFQQIKKYNWLNTADEMKTIIKF